ncbi:DUF4158 domain-containing protein [Streptomyces sp. LZ34]
MLDAGGRQLGFGGEQGGATRLGFCLMLKFFEVEGRFPDLLEDVPQAAVEYVAGLVKVPAAEFAEYDLTRRSAQPLKGVNIPIRLLSWAFPVDDEAVGVAWRGTR